jgi:hypothetical protein
MSSASVKKIDTNHIDPSKLPDPDYGPPPLPAGFPRWKYFAWDGWQMEIPVDWDLGAIETGPKGGFFRIDDEFEPRILIRWQPMRGQFDTRKSIERHFKTHYPAQKGQGPAPEPLIGASLPGLSKPFRELDYETYSVMLGDQRAVGVAAFCSKCERAFIIEMHLTEKGGAGERLIAKVLASLTDHSTSEKNRWEFFGVSCDLDADLNPASHSFKQGRIGFSVTRRGQRVNLDRWTFADIHMAKRDLKGFLHENLLKKRNMPYCSIDESEIMGHPACLFYTRKKLLDPLWKVLRVIFRLREPSYRCGYIWHCNTSNRIFMLVLGSNKHKDIDHLKSIVEDVRCCKVIY